MSSEDEPTVAGAVTPSTPTRLGDLRGWVLAGRYDIIRKIGAGSMGDVYEASDRQTRRRVAVKVLKPERAHRGVFLARFLREARSASLVRHPNVVEVIDVGQADEGPVYFVMEYLEGEDLAAVLRREHRLPWPRCRSILLQLAAALGTAHARGIVHRDIKPSNILLVPGARPGADVVKLVDFGVAKLGVDMVSRVLTSAADVVGTVLYMSPEQARGEAADPRSDVYALGVVAYQAVTGRVPFPGNDIFKVMAAHLRSVPRSPRELAPDLPPDVDAFILRALQKRPEDRFASMREVTLALGGSSQWNTQGSAGPAAHRHASPHAAPAKEDTDPHAPTVMSPVHVVAIPDDAPRPVSDPDSFDEEPTAYFRAPVGVAPRGQTTVGPIPTGPGTPGGTVAGVPGTPGRAPREHTQVTRKPVAPFIPLPAPPVAAVRSTQPAQPALASPSGEHRTDPRFVGPPSVPMSGETERATPLTLDTVDRTITRGSRSGLWAALTLLAFVLAGLVIAFATR